jgi:hypothetical protein
MGEDGAVTALLWLAGADTKSAVFDPVGEGLLRNDCME